MAADINQMAERHLDRDDRPRWVRLAEQQIACGWRLVVREAEGRAWWTREGTTQLVPIDRAREILALDFTAPTPVINADSSQTAPQPKRKPAPRRTKLGDVTVPPDADLQQVVAQLYTGTHPSGAPAAGIDAIAECLGTHKDRVRQLLSRAGIAIRPSKQARHATKKAPPVSSMPKPRRDRLPMPRQDLRERVVALYQHPVEPSLKQVAERVGVAVHTVQKCLEEAGVPRRNQGHRPHGPLPADA